MDTWMLVTTCGIPGNTMKHLAGMADRDITVACLSYIYIYKV